MKLIQFRAGDMAKDRWLTAAHSRGLDLSSWIRLALDDKADADLARAKVIGIIEPKKGASA